MAARLAKSGYRIRPKKKGRVHPQPGNQWCSEHIFTPRRTLKGRLPHLASFLYNYLV